MTPCPCPRVAGKLSTPDGRHACSLRGKRSGSNGGNHGAPALGGIRVDAFRIDKAVERAGLRSRSALVQKAIEHVEAGAAFVAARGDGIGPSTY